MSLIQYLQRHCKSPGLKATLVGAVLVTIGTTAAIVYFPWSMTSKRNIDTIVSQVNKEIILGTSQEVDRLFSGAQSAQQLLESSVTQNLINLNDPRAREAFFMGVLEANPNFTWVQFGDANGDFFGAQRVSEELLNFHTRDWDAQTQTTTATIHSYRLDNQKLQLVTTESKPMDPPFYAPDRPWYQNAMKQPGQEAWTVYVYRSTQGPGMDATIALQQEEQVIGVIGVGIELKQLSEYLKQLQGDRKGEVFIINSNQELIASTDPQEIISIQSANQSTPELKQFDTVQNPLLKFASETLQTHAVSTHNVESWQRFVHTDPETGENYYVSLTPVGYLDWMIGTVIPESSYLVEINRNKQVLFVVITVFIVTTAGLAIYLIDRIIAQPILNVARAAADVEASVFELNSLNPIAKREDELGQLARVFQTMARQVYVREQTLKRQVQELRIEIDEVKRQKQVKEIVETDFFQDLTTKAQTLRKRSQDRLREKQTDRVYSGD